uniref:Uncharacterized protein n=1 Tax=Rhizophora mucronata TaxID=61149 RepID=A0A2P2NV21_RHIMU
MRGLIHIISYIRSINGIGTDNK